ncbi:MAG: PglZ domain-containing protein [Candidatus Methanofastidiosa archaeon]|nr:PglZ domain-containing protein [Candidatus Methanofastidiosa archaeon]
MKFNLNIPDEVQWPEISNRLAETIFQSFFLSQPCEDIRNFYLSWEDSLSNEESLMHHSTKFEKHFYNQLIETMETFYDNHRHPFPQIEKEIFLQKIKDIIENRDPQSAFKFAKERMKKRKRNQYDKNNKIYWGELIELEFLLEEVQIDSIQNLSNFVHEYEKKLWRFDNLDLILTHSPLPHTIRDWAKKKINHVKKRINEKWQELFQPESISAEQVGFIYKTLQQNGKHAIIVVDALRYEVAQEINPSQGIKKELRGIFATLPSITSVGMAALFSSGKVNRIMNEKNSFLIVDQQTDITLDTVENRKKNIQKLIDGVEFYDFQSLPEELCDKCVITTRSLDELGHDELIKYIDLFIQDIHQVIVTLIEKGFTIHIISDHGFYYFGTDPKINETTEDSFETMPRYKLLNHRPVSGIFEAINDNIFIQYAFNDTIFHKSSKNFWHGGASLQEVFIPVIKFTPLKEKMKRSVKIYNKEHLGVVRRNKIEVILYSDTVVGEPRQVYLEVNQRRFEVNDLIQSETVKIIINLDIKDGDFFVIEVRDLKDGTLLDQVKGRFEPLREKYF